MTSLMRRHLNGVKPNRSQFPYFWNSSAIAFFEKRTAKFASVDSPIGTYFPIVNFLHKKQQQNIYKNKFTKHKKTYFLLHLLHLRCRFVAVTDCDADQ